MITCPQCGTQNQPGAAFCDNCGASLTGIRPAGTAAGAPVAAPAVAPAAGGLSCPACGSPVVAGQAFCDNCGAAITAAPPVAPVAGPAVPAAPPVAPAAAPAGMVKCPSCGQLNPAGQAFCDNCGTQLAGQPAVVGSGVGPAPAVPPPPVAPPLAMRPRLVVTATGAQFDLTGKSQVLIGREDPVSGIFPEVDLTPHGGDAAGVSRRHAKLTFNGFQWTIEDLNSTNFTWVNNQKLTPGVPQPLNNGDQVRLGKLVLTFQTA